MFIRVPTFAFGVYHECRGEKKTANKLLWPSEPNNQVMW